MVFQKPTPFPMTIYDNIAFGVKLHEKLSQVGDGRAGGMVAHPRRAVGRGEGPAETSAMGLSGGQQQRLCIARTIAVRPEVILLDEPTSALDPISTLKIEELIDELKHDFTIAIVTHNMQQAARCADQVAFFYIGEMVEVAPAVQMFTAPQGTPHAGIHHRPVRLIGKADAMSEAPEHLVKSYDQELKRLRNLMTEMGGIVENQVALAAEAITTLDATPAMRVVEQTRRSMRWSVRPSNSSSACWRCGSRWPGICARLSRP